MTYTPWLTLLLFSLRLGVALLLLTEGSLIALALWKKKRQRTKAHSKPRVFSEFMEEWAHREIR
jgi:hypothetical protein